MASETRRKRSRKSEEGAKEESAEANEGTEGPKTAKDLVVKLKKGAPALKIKIRRSKEDESSKNTVHRGKLVVKIPSEPKKDEKDSDLTRELLSILRLQGTRKNVDTAPDYLQDQFLILWDFLIQFRVITAPLAISYIS
jgi:hypothetical protein